MTFKKIVAAAKDVGTVVAVIGSGYLAYKAGTSNTIKDVIGNEGNLAVIAVGTAITAGGLGAAIAGSTIDNKFANTIGHIRNGMVYGAAGGAVGAGLNYAINRTNNSMIPSGEVLGG